MLSHRDWDTLEALKKTSKGQLRYNKQQVEEQEDVSQTTIVLSPYAGWVLDNVIANRKLESSFDHEEADQNHVAQNHVTLSPVAEPQSPITFSNSSLIHENGATGMQEEESCKEEARLYLNPMSPTVIAYETKLRAYTEEQRKKMQDEVKARQEKFNQLSKAVAEKAGEQYKRFQEMTELRLRQERQLLQEQMEQSSKEALRQQEKLKEEHRHRAKLLNLRLREAEQQRQRELENRCQEEGRERMRRLCDLQHEALQLIQKIETDQKLQNTLHIDLSSFSQRGNNICGNLSNVVRKCSENQFPSQDDVLAGERFVLEMRALVSDMEKEVAAAQKRLMAEEDAARQQREAEQAQQQAQAQALAQANAAAQEKARAEKELQKNAQKSIMEPYEELQKKMEQCLVTIKPLTDPGQDKKIKKIRTDLARAVLGPVNQISPISGVKVMEVFHTINDFLKGNPVRRNDGPISLAQHPQALEYVYYKLAARFVEQGGDEVASHHEAAFSIALVVSGIWEKHPRVGELFLGYLYKNCPYAFPFYPIHEKGVPLLEYQRILGYRVEDSIVENQDHFLKRMSGMIRLYAAILQMRWPEKTQRHHPHGLNHGWRWMADLLNMEPLPDITATVLFNFLEVCGNALMKLYKGQFWKLILLIKEDFLLRIKNVTAAGQMGSVTRLQQFLEDILRRRDIPLPKGYPGPSFWRT